MKINKIDEFIKFVTSVFNDEFDYCIDYVDSRYYFLNGGCFELAYIIKHYFPENTEYVMRKDNNHCAILCDEIIYDAYDGYEEDELSKFGINKNEIIKNKDDYRIISEEEILKLPFGRNIYIEGNNVPNALIMELNNIDTVVINK
jgi:hypothetical protein